MCIYRIFIIEIYQMSILYAKHHCNGLFVYWVQKSSL